MFRDLSSYGVYYVRVTVMNNVSSLTLPTTVIQVGENVTSLDVYVDNWLVDVSAPVSVTIVCPRGWPRILTVDMGDGEPPQRIVHPADYDPASDDCAPRVRGGSTLSTTPAPGGRRRRDVAETANIGQPFQLTYHYRTPGHYRYVRLLVTLAASVAVKQRSDACSSVCLSVGSALQPIHTARRRHDSTRPSSC